MNTRNFTTVFTVDETPEAAFAAINDVRGWWSAVPGIEGSTDQLGAEFTYRYEPYHWSRQRITELIPGKKVVWLVVEGQLHFLKDKNEWTGTQMVFDITRKGDGKTEVRFTHVGLVPDEECYGACANAWGSLINVDLRNLILAGTAQPHRELSSKA